MRAFIMGLCLLSGVAWPRQITGSVVGAAGSPVAGAFIDDSNNFQNRKTTGADGRFEIETQAPALVVRKPGFHSVLVRTGTAADIRVTLTELSRPQFPTCPEAGSFVGLQAGMFRFASIPEIKTGGRGRDIDYTTGFYYVDTKDGRKGVGQASGPMWSWGPPLDSFVWNSSTYDEAVYQFDRIVIIDARGTLADSSHWRSLGMFGETATYKDVDAATARILDRFLDGACMKPWRPPQ